MVRVIFEDEDLFDVVRDMVNNIMANKGMDNEEVFEKALSEAWQYVETMQKAKMCCKMSEVNKRIVGVIGKKAI